MPGNRATVRQCYTTVHGVSPSLCARLVPTVWLIQRWNAAESSHSGNNIHVETVLPRPVAHLLWMTFGEGIADELPRRIPSPSASVCSARSGSFGVACRPADIRTRHSSPSVVVKHCRRGKSAAEVPRPLPPFHFPPIPLSTFPPLPPSHSSSFPLFHFPEP